MSRRKKNKRGKFIVFEGLDGSGTTTQSHLLAQYLEKERWPVINTSEPTQGPMGLIIRLVLSNRLIFGSSVPEMEILSNSSIALLFAADRLDHLQHLVIPKIEDGVIVLCDRYFFSSYAYQMGKDPDNFQWLRTINSRCIVPDLTIFLNTSLSICEKRRSRNRWYQELYEKPDILSQVSKNYEYILDTLKDEMPIEVIDGNPSDKVVFGKVLNVIQEKFPEMFPGDLPLFPAQ